MVLYRIVSIERRFVNFNPIPALHAQARHHYGVATHPHRWDGRSCGSSVKVRHENLSYHGNIALLPGFCRRNNRSHDRAALQTARSNSINAVRHSPITTLQHVCRSRWLWLSFAVIVDVVERVRVGLSFRHIYSAHNFCSFSASHAVCNFCRPSLPDSRFPRVRGESTTENADICHRFKRYLWPMSCAA